MSTENTEERNTRPQDEQLVTGDYGPFTGCCKWFNNKIGYGFITVMNGEHKGKDIFVHHSGVWIRIGNWQYIYYEAINAFTFKDTRKW